MSVIENSLQRAIKRIAASTLRSSGDMIEVYSGMTQNTVPLAPISLYITYDFDLKVIPYAGSVRTDSFENFRDDLKLHSLDYFEVMTALALAVAACQ